MYKVLKKNIDIKYFLNTSTLLVFSKIKKKLLKMPSFYYVSNSENNIKFVFFSKYLSKSFISFFNNILCSFSYFRFIRLKIKGLGYTITEISDSIHAFCFNWINFIYIFVPFSIWLKIYKKRFFMISKEWCILKIILDQILNLKRVGPYTMRGLRLAKSILFIKKLKKKT